MKFVIDAVEKSRLKKLTTYEKKARDQGFKIVVGVDEAGRGPLAGPVVAAACFLPDKLLICGIDDSKKLTPKMRDELFEYLMSDKRIKYGIGTVCSVEIDRINILQATIVAMQLAVEALPLTPDLLLVDGLKLPHPTIPSEKIIRGDALSQSIAAASIIAKVTRDRMMLEYHAKWPQYGFDSHKGYGTARHVDAIHQFGPCSLHRQSFEPIKSIVA